LNDALDAVSDGMPADHVAMLLYVALDRLSKGETPDSKRRQAPPGQ
jgi:hypothetical protein